MALRHVPRPSDRDRHLEPSSSVAHPLIPHPPHPSQHINGGTSSGPVANAAIVSPIVVSSSTAPNGQPASTSPVHKLAIANEHTWLLIGRIAEQMGDLEHAQSAYENALRHNPMSLSALQQVAGIARIKENYPMAVEYFQRVISLQEDNGEVWSALGHCYLMQDDLQKAYSAYQQALYLLPQPKEDPKLWYGIGILYDRYGSLDHAEEAFSSVLKMDKDLDFDKANEILFRLGIIYKQQGKYDESLACFDRILRNPPSPLAHADIWFQIGHVYEQQKDHVRAKDAYERVVADNPGHAKVLQQLGWLYHQDGSSFQNQDLAISYLTKSLEADGGDAQSWYLLGRAYMAGQKYNKAYEAYQQAVYRDGRNPTFWCSIGVLYFQINQFRDALDAYSRAIRINPYISEVWFDLGSLYESCNNQISDAIDAYARASELDPQNPVISQRLQLLRNAQATGGVLPAAPGPQDVHPTAYSSAVVPPGLAGPPLLLQGGRPGYRAESRGPGGDPSVSLPPPAQVNSRSSPGPFRGGPPPPVIIDESRQLPSHALLAPMDVDRPPMHLRDYPAPPRGEGVSRGPVGHQSLLLHHPVPQQQLPTEDIRNGHRPPLRVPSRSASPPSHPTRVRTPANSYQMYARQPSGPGQLSSVAHRSPHYPHEPARLSAVEPEGSWDRRGAHSEQSREWDRERRPRHGGNGGSSAGEYPPPPAHPQQYAFNARSPEPSPRASHSSRAHWDSKPLSGPSAPPAPVRASPPRHAPMGLRYDPRHDGRDQRDAERDVDVEHPHETRGAFAAGSSSTSSNMGRHVPPVQVPSSAPRPGSESPRPARSADPSGRRRLRETKETEMAPTPVSSLSRPDQGQKKEKKKRLTSKRIKEEPPAQEGSRTFVEHPAPVPAGSSKAVYKQGRGETPPSATNRSASSSRSDLPSPTSAVPRAPPRFVDEDYDEGVTDALISLASYRGGVTASQRSTGTRNRSPPVSASSRGSAHSGSAHSPTHTHRGSISSTRSHASPPPPPTLPPPTSQAGPPPMKRPLSPASDQTSDSKRVRVDASKRRASMTPPSVGGPPSPPFRTQSGLPALSSNISHSHSPEERPQMEVLSYSQSSPPPPLAVVLPPHPRPIGTGMSASHGGGLSSSSSSSGSNVGGSGNVSSGGAIALPPIATLATSPTPPSMMDESMNVDKETMSQSPPRKTSSLSPASSMPGAASDPA